MKQSARFRSLNLCMLSTCTLISVTYLFGCEQTPHRSADQGQTDAEIERDDATSLLPNQTCSGYFGQPNEQSGLSEEVCNTSCACEEGQHSWSQPLTTSPLFNLRQSDPPSPLEVDPYLEPESATDSPTLNEEACVILIDSSAETYRLETRPLREADPALVTHLGPCGACSSLHDLKVYLERTDLTEPVRSCGLQSISRGQEEGVRCLRELGFSEPCATIWYFNTLNTRSRCLEVCLAHLRSPYVDEEGALNPCLACDEEESGPIFKRYAGRTRRNSGITSAICRPCDTVSSVSHVYLESTAAPLTSPE